MKRWGQKWPAGLAVWGEAAERQAPGGGSEQLPRPQGAALPSRTGQRLMNRVLGCAGHGVSSERTGLSGCKKLLN